MNIRIRVVIALAALSLAGRLPAPGQELWVVDSANMVRLDEHLGAEWAPPAPYQPANGWEAHLLAAWDRHVGALRAILHGSERAWWADAVLAVADASPNLPILRAVDDIVPAYIESWARRLAVEGAWQQCSKRDPSRCWPVVHNRNGAGFLRLLVRAAAAAGEDLLPAHPDAPRLPTSRALAAEDRDAQAQRSEVFGEADRLADEMGWPRPRLGVDR